jgi:glycerophosphoryl diester phosphodiesterase
MIVLGHRGGKGPGWPAENSLAAFQRAIDEGADGVELDVRLCASGEVVLVHDRTLASITGGADRRAVSGVRYADLPRAPDGERIALLEEALDSCRGRIVNVEVKADAPGRLALVRAAIGVIRRARPVDVVISSFDPATVLACTVVAPDIPRAMLVGPRTPRLATALPLSMRAAICAAHVGDDLISEGRLARLRRAQLRTVAWTVNDATRAQALERMGLDWIITDRPGEIVGAVAIR